MTVDELRNWLTGVPGTTEVAVVLLERCGATIEAVPGADTGISFELADSGEPQRVWITATPTRIEPISGNYRCPCGTDVRYGDDTDQGRGHLDCQ